MGDLGLTNLKIFGIIRERYRRRDLTIQTSVSSTNTVAIVNIDTAHIRSMYEGKETAMSYKYRKSDHEIEGQGSSGKARVNGNQRDGGGLNRPTHNSPEPESSGGWSGLVTRMSEVESEDIQWLWERRVPMGHMTVLAGLQGQGKTFVALEMAKALSLGEPLPDSDVAIQGATLIISTEDGVANTLKPRLEAMGADVSQIYAVNFDQVVTGMDVPTIASDMDDLEEEIIKPYKIKLVILDPLTGLLGKTDDNSNILME